MLTCSVGVGPYDRTLPLMAGLFNIEGVRCEFEIAPLEELFARAFDEVAFDIAELSFSNFLYLTATGNCPYVGVPVFPSRSFRHSAVYVRRDRAINRASDLHGRTVGVREFSMTAALVARGILEDEYGVRSQHVRWRYGPADAGDTMPIARMLPRGIELEAIPADSNLTDLLLKGELDAMVAYKPPKIELGDATGIDRLFPDYPAVEAEYARRTGIFPIMHLVGVRRSLVENDPTLCVRICEAFEQSRAYAMARIGEQQAPFTVLPWGSVEADRTTTALQDALGNDYWSYGVAKNRAALESLCRYSFEQGIAPRKLNLDELFATSTYDWNP